MRKVKVAAFMVIIILVMIFTLQNTEQVEIRFLFWQLALSRSLLLFLVFALGLLSGFVLSVVKIDEGHDQGQGGPDL